MKSLIALLSCAGTALAVSRTSAPAGCITVGSGGYSTIQAAVNSLSTSASGTQCIFISPGTYKEQVLVSARSAQLTIYGSTTDTTGYAANSVTITGSKSQADGLSNDETATLRVKAANFKLYNVNVANTYGKGSQAVALSAYADSGYYASVFTGYQDTLLANTGKQLYAGSLIQGATDFIFGQNAAAWFEDSDIRVVSASLGYITGRSPGGSVRLSSRAGDETNRISAQPTAGPPRAEHHTTCSTTATWPLRPATASATARITSAGRGASTRAWSSRRPL